MKDEIDGEFFQALEDELEKVPTHARSTRGGRCSCCPHGIRCEQSVRVAHAQVNRAFHEHASEVEAALEHSVDPGRRTSFADTAGSSAADAATSQEKNDAAHKREQEFYDSYRTLGRLQVMPRGPRAMRDPSASLHCPLPHGNLPRSP